MPLVEEVSPSKLVEVRNLVHELFLVVQINIARYIIKKFNAFITDTVFDFPTKTLRITVRKSDSNLVLQTRVRKRLRAE